MEDNIEILAHKELLKLHKHTTLCINSHEENIFTQGFNCGIKNTLWTPITGEASLPKDDEALCLFAEWEGGIMKDRWIVKWKVAKTDISHHPFTHYTILTKPKQ